MLKQLRKCIERETKNIMNGHDVGGHGFDHFIAVRNHALKALEFENISTTKKLQVELAAFLHDVDDPKIFPTSINYQNALLVLDASFSEIKFDDLVSDITFDSFKNDVIQLISLVSCSKNGDDEPPEPWMAIPRDADRLEAIGEIGITRCRDFAIHINLPFYTSETPIAKTREDVLKFATIERFNKYKSGHKSISMIDHYYDKLLHIGKSACLRSQNTYILGEAEKRNEIMIDFVLNFKY
ncbi:Metal dependent phosphohydrolase [Acanthamoeba polyphaga moumouvirus]|uniref:Metal dependent phosphohydrolase n=1 Tax=Acanthamoeba polyphaga moumouvirus TaxID=1269028 RepID=L7RDH5_9VIRU|nr:Metal dependent phosphohydrolase [Acanthamoeba polyphaga moumouvirus]AGC02341.1 Metal dependent phosphohydrolase [Acanthamoeba polyphaga moumouvirus]